MKKILLITNKVMHYRVSIYNYFQKQFENNGWEFIVRSNAIQEENPYSINFDFNIIEFSFKNYKHEIEKINPDIIIIFLHLKDKIIWPLVHWLKIKKKLIFFWTKGLNLDEPNNKISFILYRYFHIIFDRLVLYSKKELMYINKNNHHKVFVANNTLNFNDFPPIHESKEKIKREFNIPFNKVVLSVGRMEAGSGRKKINHLIEIFRNIKIDGIGLVIVGSGINNELINALNKQNTIYLGELYDPKNIKISKIFKMSDIFSIPGHVGLGLNQAMYWGLPVVTEEGCQPPEINYLINGRNGYIVPENDVKALKLKILHLLNDDDLRKEMSKNAMSDILENASIEKMFFGFKNCIDSI